MKTVWCCVHSLTSTGLSTCKWTAEVMYWLLTPAAIAFYCWTVSYAWNASSSTLNSSTGIACNCILMNAHYSCTLHNGTWTLTVAIASCHSSVCNDWQTNDHSSSAYRTFPRLLTLLPHCMFSCLFSLSCIVFMCVFLSLLWFIFSFFSSLLFIIQ